MTTHTETGIAPLVGEESIPARRGALATQLLREGNTTPRLHKLVEKRLAGERWTPEEGVTILEGLPLVMLQPLAEWWRLERSGLRAYYNRNVHIEPTNICRFHCSFCSFKREPSSSEAWMLSHEEIAQRVHAALALGVTEIHITGGIPEEWGLGHLKEAIALVRKQAPEVHIKAYSAVELCAVLDQEGIPYKEGLAILKEAGLDSIPGGGAEILDDSLRATLCPDKCSSQEWLDLHRAWHQLGGHSNATMLFGHIEEPKQLVAHLEQLRGLQDETHGFNCFIPLKYRAAGNSLGIAEATPETVQRIYTFSGLYLDNFPHLKVYWPMLGKENIHLMLRNGADDLDGTIGSTTRIYTMAGQPDASASIAELRNYVSAAGYIPLERDSLYRELTERV